MLNQLMCARGVEGTLGDMRGRRGDAGGCRGDVGGTDAPFIPHSAWMCVLTGYPA